MEEFTFKRERISAFTDAVFSIAITLLILDISLPDASSVKSMSTWLLLEQLIPNFIGFIVSFFVISLYWKFYLIYYRYVDQQTFLVQHISIVFCSVAAFFNLVFC